MDILVKTKKWGNSIGIIIPVDIIEQEDIKPGEEISIHIEKKQNVLKELFGALKFKKTTEELLNDFRKETESKWVK